MRASTVLAPLFLAATSLAQGVEEGIAPSQGPPSGCEPNANGNFTIGTLKVHHASKKRESAVEAADSALVCNLVDGILRDRDGRTGSVVANRQFQFDGPPQAGAIYTGGFSICTNGSLAIGGSTRWWQCSSGGFYNLYDEWIGSQCEEIRIQVTFPQKPSSSPSASAGASRSTGTSTSSLSISVASVASSLATISGPVSTVSKSAVGPSASFASSNVPATRGSASATRTSGNAGQTGSADAPPAAGGAGRAAFGVAQGSILGAFVIIFGAALIL